jgi:hypothetical protein
MNKPKTVTLRPSVLGSKTFFDWLKDTFFMEKSNLEVPASKMLSPSTTVIKDVVCRFYQIDPEQLLLVKRGTENEPRDVAISE